MLGAPVQHKHLVQSSVLRCAAWWARAMELTYGANLTSMESAIRRVQSAWRLLAWVMIVEVSLDIFVPSGRAVGHRLATAKQAFRIASEDEGFKPLRETEHTLKGHYRCTYHTFYKHTVKIWHQKRST